MPAVEDKEAPFDPFDHDEFSTDYYEWVRRMQNGENTHGFRFTATTLVPAGFDIDADLVASAAKENGYQTFFLAALEAAQKVGVPAGLSDDDPSYDEYMADWSKQLFDSMMELGGIEATLVFMQCSEVILATAKRFVQIGPRASFEELIEAGKAYAILEIIPHEGDGPPALLTAYDGSREEG